MADQQLQTILNSGGISSIYVGGITTGDKVLKKSELDSAYAPLVADYARLNPVATPPAHVAGQFYYSSTTGTFNIQGPYAGIEVSPGHGEHLHVVNNSGATIPAGSAVRIAGASGGIPQIVLAQANSFANANVAGVTVLDVPNGTETAIAISGVISLDTSLLSIGGPYYLSATTPGAYTTTAPAIRTEVGGVLVSAVDGKFRTDIKVNEVTPTVLGILNGQTTPLYSVTTTPQNIVEYSTSKEVVTTANITTGAITLPNNGSYRANITAEIAFPSATSTRNITIELYETTGAIIHFSYVKNIPRDATEDSFSFSWPLEEVAGNAHVLRIKSNVAIDITFTSLSFDIESIVITA